MRGAEPAALRQQDREARRRAQVQFDRPLALEAGAGTGKTTTLVARILAWSLGPGWSRAEARLSGSWSSARTSASRGEAKQAELDERIAADVLTRIVAITFTEAAAAEMSSRVADTLARLAKGETPSWLLPEAVPEASVLQRRAQALAVTLDHFAARTIHGYCRSLLSQHALEAGLHPRLTIDADGDVTDEVVREVVEAQLQAAYSNPEDAVYLPLAAEGVGPREIAQALCELVAEGAPTSLLMTPIAHLDGWLSLAARLHQLLEALGTAATALEGLPTHHRLGRGVLASTWRSLSALQPLLGPELRRDREAQLEALLSELRGLWGESLERLATWARNEFTQTEARLLGPRRGPRVRGLCEQLHPMLRHALELSPRRLELRRRALEPLYRQVRAELRRRGVMTFEDLLIETRALLESGSVVVRQVRAQVEQFLVDEFQDTDHLQCEIVERLTLWQEQDAGPQQDGSEAPGLFVVGDPKQSIFGWRSADLRAYDDFLARLRERGGSVFHLSENYRSVPAILEHVQRLVEPVMREEVGLQPRFVPLLASPERSAAAEEEAEDVTGPSLEHWISWTQEGPKTKVRQAAELEATALAQDLARLHRAGVEWRRIGVLFRSGNDIAMYLDALRAANIPFLVARDPQYYRRREIIELTALIRMVLDPTDHLALITALRAVYIGVPDAALLPLWQAGLPTRFATLGDTTDDLDGWLASILPRVPRDVPGFERMPDWSRSLRAAARHIAELRRSFRREPADRFVERLRHRFLQEPLESSRYLGAFRLANLARLLRRLREWLEEGGEVSVLLRRLRRNLAEVDDTDRERPADSHEDAVRLLTIHRAKGLDFRHVYVMQLHKQTSQQPRRTTEVASVRTVEGREQEFRLLGLASPGFDLIRREQRAVADAERVRLLYVAVTRARRRLVLAGIWPDEADGTPPEGASAAPLASSAICLVDLVAASIEAENETPRVPRLLAACQESGRPFLDRRGVRWCFPALVPPSEPLPSPVSRPLDFGSMQAEAAALQARRRRARSRMEAPRRRAASDEAHSELVEQLLSSREALGWPQPEASSLEAPGLGVQRQVAQAVGTVVHRTLETLDLEQSPAAALAAQVALLPRRLKDLLPGEHLDVALARSRELLASFSRGRLLDDLWRLREQILGREIPVWLAPEQEPGGDGGRSSAQTPGPLEVVAGTIDMLYREPAGEHLVIVDYKTDAITSPQELAARVDAYSRQGAVYQQALQRALDLPHPPAFELWFLALDRRVRSPQA